jgi:hypothetical protein
MSAAPVRNTVTNRLYVQPAALDAEVQAAIGNNSAMAERLKAATELIRSLGFFLDRDGECYVIKSRSNNQKYFVTAQRCQCEFYAKQRRDRWCAHRLAVVLAERAASRVKAAAAEATKRVQAAYPEPSVMCSAQLAGQTLTLSHRGRTAQVRLTEAQAETLWAQLEGK